jgi:hypothetical protein
MITLTRPQRIALKRIYDSAKVTNPDLNYRAFRRTVVPYFGGTGCVLVPCPWANIWVGIETDGYAHS